jgi:multiple sugar transport system ATP-binding protein
MGVVAIDRLTKQYDGGSEAAVREISFSVADGEFMVLLGPSGCGKSTVLRMIAGLEPITSGSISIDGQVMNNIPARDRDIAMVFQSYALYPHMSVYDNLAFGLRRRDIPRIEIEKRVHTAAEKLGLTPFLTRKPHALSGGQRQRVALGRAIVRKPKVFLFDEPLSNLDAALRVSTRNELIRQQQEIGITTIYVTHDQVEAMTMGHRICIMNKGEVVQIGKPLEVYGDPANTFVARFLGNPPMNLLTGTLEITESQMRARVGDVTIPLSGWSNGTLAPRTNAAVIVGIRPEDLYERAEAADAAHRVPLVTRALAVEPLGAETLLVLALEGRDEEIIARVGRETNVKMGDAVTIGLDTTAIHLFDPTTTHVIPRDRHERVREAAR